MDRNLKSSAARLSCVVRPLSGLFLSSFLFAGLVLVPVRGQESAAAVLAELRRGPAPSTIRAETAGRAALSQRKGEGARIQTDGFIAAAAKAKDFQRRFPNDPNLNEVRRIEAVSLIRAAQGGDIASVHEAERASREFLADRRVSKADRYTVAAIEKSWEVQRKKLPTAAAYLAEYERNARLLQAEYADVPAVYDLFLSMAINAEEAKARALVAEIQSLPAPEQVKVAARQIIERYDLPGKKLDLQLRTLGGKDIDLSVLQPGPVVVYLWSDVGTATRWQMPLIRAAAAAHPNAQFVGVNLDADPRPIREGLDGEAVPGLKIWEPLGLRGVLPKQLFAQQIPWVYVFDKSGILHGMGDPHRLADLLTEAKKR